ncbi:tetratricopeptide repeat protein [Dactylosporangium sp. NPDC000521]|uniref:tetratricopeptide repeat protein n=1 Tax=Dactylosporangium sp. NPDC000521 TaxID=3363975 RepID=UPI003677AA85
MNDALDRGQPGVNFARAVEVHRLAVAGGESVIARDVGDQVARLWLQTSRFADVAVLASATLTLGPDAGAFFDRGGARRATGQPRLALADYEQALAMYREIADRVNEAATLNDIGAVYNNLGDRQQALTFYQQALSIQRDVGDRGNEAATLNNIGHVFDRLGDWQQALTFYQQALPMTRDVGDRAGEAATLNNIGAVYNNLGDRQQALTFYQQALSIKREVGDRAGEAVTLNNIGHMFDGLGDRQQALGYYQQALSIQREVGDRTGEAATLNNIGHVFDSLGDRQQALAFYQQALSIRRDVGDRAGEAVTLNSFGAVYNDLGDRQQALTYFRQALPIRREVGDRAGEAATLNNIGHVFDGLGDRQQALAYYQQALSIQREVGDRAGEASTLNNIGGIRYQQGDLIGAVDALHEVLDLVRAVGDRSVEATVSYNMATLFAQMARIDDAVKIQRRAIALAEATETPFAASDANVPRATSRAEGLGNGRCHSQPGTAGERVPADRAAALTDRRGSVTQLDMFELEIFEQTSSYCEVRLSEDGAAPRTRGLDRAVVEQLIDLVERDYSQDSVAQRVDGSPRLRELGAKLAAFVDGDQRWLHPMLGRPPGATLRITAEERLRHLPWELLCQDGSFLTVAGPAPLLPVRAVGTSAALQTPFTPGNRPLRVLFMATSPEGVEPVLNYEAEEAAILAATSRTGTDLVVEESGTLEGLRFLTRDYGQGYFDVLHLSGHATTATGQPTFVVENELGGHATATADQIAQAMAGHWPRLVFVSGCLTGNAPDRGAFPSMSESLVRAGAPAVLGWALPVGDDSATEFAAELYRALAGGQALDQAVIEARQHLFTNKRGSWHLLRVYADRSPLAPLVTPLNTRGRTRIQARAADQEFLDPQTQLSRVAARAAFVGRRRVIQRCLRTLKQPLHEPGGAEALVLHGMGGLGKSSLASRILERMPTHQRAVWYGRVDLTKFRELTTKVRFPALEQQAEADKQLSNDQVPLASRLRYLLDVDGPLGQTPCLFVFDDFEDGNLDERDGSHVLSAAMADILPALLTAIRQTNSPSRVIITSRYLFPTPAGTRIATEALETLIPVEQDKKIANLPNLRHGSPIDPNIRTRAIQAAAGNPRLLDWLDLIVADPTLDVDGLIAAIENEAERFRESILAAKLLGSQDPDLQKMLAKLNVVELPVPGETVHAVHDHPDATHHIERATRLGLLEAGTDPETQQPRYYVSNILRPLVRPLLTDDEYVQACAAAARSLHTIWFTNPTAPGPPS